MAASLQLTAYEKPESIDIVNNTSQLFVQLLIVTTSGTYNETGDTTGSITVNGQDYSLDGAKIKINTTTVLYEATHTVVHTIDGTKTVTVAARFDPNTPATSEMTQTQTVELTAIPRASTVAAADADIGAVSMVAINRKSPSYRHSVSWQFGELSGWLKADGSVSEEEEIFSETTVGFLLPESFCEQIPNSAVGICTLTCTTYSAEGNRIGQPQSCQFSAKVDGLKYGPDMELQVVDENPVTLALTGEQTRLVRHASTALCTLTATAYMGASIVSRQVADQEIEGQSLSIPNFAGERIFASATDSRGNTAICYISLDTVYYVPLTVNVTAGRTDPTSGRALVRIQGNYFSGSFGARSNSLSITCQVGAQVFTVEPEIEGTTYRAELALEGLDYLQSHTVSITASDQIHTFTKSVVVGKGIPVFDWGESDFRFHVPVRIPAPTADDHAVNKVWAVAKSGDVMTGPLAVPQLTVQADGYPGVYICRADGSLMGTFSSGDDHGCVYLTNNNDSAYEAFFTPKITPGRVGGAVFEFLTTKAPVAVHQGGTGAADAAAARSNLGIGCTALFSGNLDTVGVQQALAAGYSAYLVMGCPRSGSSIVSQLIPAAALTQSAVRYQLADDANYCAFEMWHVDGVPVLQKAAGAGAITAVFGIN